MVVLHALGDVNHPDLFVVVQEIVFAQVAMYQFACLVEVSHHYDAFFIEMNDLQTIITSDNRIL